jgi:polar amino acid transport system substrate-binding protein
MAVRRRLLAVLPRWRRGLAVLAMLTWGLAAADQAPIKLLTFDEPPWVDAQKQPLQGPTIELVKQLFAQAGVPYSFEVLPLKRALKMANSQPGTCVFPIERSQERETALRWISPLVVSRYGFYSAPGHALNLQTLEDARPYSIASYLGSGVGEYLLSRGFNVVEVSSAKLGPNMLAHKRFDLWVSDTRTAQALNTSSGATLGQPALVFLSTLRAMGCHPDTSNTSLELLQSALLQMLKIPEWREKVFSQPL